jgi:hypothetical protein
MDESCLLRMTVQAIWMDILNIFCGVLHEIWKVEPSNGRLLC